MSNPLCAITQYQQAIVCGALHEAGLSESQIAIAFGKTIRDRKTGEQLPGRHWARIRILAAGLARMSPEFDRALRLKFDCKRPGVASGLRWGDIPALHKAWHATAGQFAGELQRCRRRSSKEAAASY